MKPYLSEDSAWLYFHSCRLGLAQGWLSLRQFVFHLLCLKQLADPDSDLHEICSSVLKQHPSRDTGAPEESWHDSGRNTGENSKVSEDRGGFKRQDDDGGMIHLIPSWVPGMKQWKFNKYDPDPFPSVPHGHHTSIATKKLNPYTGFIFQRTRQTTERESRDSIVQLWNDSKFRAFVLESITWYIDQFPRINWPVSNPRRLPRKRRKK